MTLTAAAILTVLQIAGVALAIVVWLAVITVMLHSLKGKSA